VPPLLRPEIERESARLKLVKDQVRSIESAHRRELAERKHPMVAELARLWAIGDKGAWVLVKEIFGWRNFSNRCELTACVGLAPTPHARGSIDHEQGISKTGNRRARSVLIEQAWSWVRLQLSGELTHWFNRRFWRLRKADASGRVGIEQQHLDQRSTRP
jgi:transposase